MKNAQEIEKAEKKTVCQRGGFLVRYDPVVRLFLNRNMTARNCLVLFLRQRCGGSGLKFAVLCRRFRMFGGDRRGSCRKKKLSFPRCWSTVLLEGHMLDPLSLCQVIRC
jgi:hypothetical protein